MTSGQMHYLKLFQEPCFYVEELANAYVDGELHPVLRRRFERHFSHCGACREVVRETMRLIEVARSLDEPRMPRDVSARLRKRLRERVGYCSRDDSAQLVLLSPDRLSRH